MTNSLSERIKKIYADKKRRQAIFACVCAMSLFVAGCVFWQLRFIGVTKTAETCCGLKEHIHSESCAGERVLTCGFEEGIDEQICNQEHVHDDNCFTAVDILSCEQPEHVHNDNCFKTEDILVCEQTEHVHDENCILSSSHVHSDACYEIKNPCEMEEHEHTILCFSDVSADVETSEDWCRTLPESLEMSVRTNLVSIAWSQVGYTESERNFILSEDGLTQQHYTRYGQWYGNPYGNWNAMFASFCVSYAGVSQSEIPYSANTLSWMNALDSKGLFFSPEKYQVQSGDLVFSHDQGYPGQTVVGIVVDVDESKLAVIVGDINGIVDIVHIPVDNPNIIGFVCTEVPEENNDSGILNDEFSEETSEENEREDGSEVTELTAYGDDYKVTVSFTAEAGIPNTAELFVEELKQDSLEYKRYFQETLDAMDLDVAPVFCRFFDISFIKNGAEIEPQMPVDVAITYTDVLPVFETDKCTAVHFAETGLELIDAQLESGEEGDVVSFTQDTFSVVGTVIEGSVSLSAGQGYIFYTGDGYALGVVRSGYNSYSISPVKINVGSNGYVVPNNQSVDIASITWKYSNGGLYNAYSNRYLNLVASTPRNITGTRYTSTVGLSTAVKTISSFDINNSLRLSQNYSSLRPFMLAYENNEYKSGTEFDNAQLYHLTALVGQVSDELVLPGNLTIRDAIRESGHLVPNWNVTPPNGELTYVWEKSVNGGSTWDVVTRRKITGEEYNVAEDGTWLNVALDSGAEAQYRVSLVAVNDQAISNRVVSQTYWVPYYDELKNGDFEMPVVPSDTSASTYQPFLPNGTAQMVWKTTAADGQIEYVSVANSSYQSLSQQWHLCEAANDGKQYVELNATRGGALYQDVLTIPGSTMYWQLAHRARGTRYRSGEVDTMYVVIMSTALAEQYNITTQSAVQDVINNPSKYPGAQVRVISSDNKQWHINEGQYVVPEQQYLSRYFFVSGSTASRDLTVGNHLDSVSFSINLPPPAPGKANIEVVKQIEGLTYEDARALFSNIDFSISNASHTTSYHFTGSEFSQLMNNGDGTYSAKYVLTGISPGQYEIVEDNTTGNADLAGFDRATSILSESAVHNAFNNNGRYGIMINARIGSTANVVIYNTYQPKTTEITVIKKGSDETLLRAEFELSSRTTTGWNFVRTFVTENGQIILDNLSYSTVYKLTEITPPDGYVGITDPVYFVIHEDGIHICSEDGNLIQPAEYILIEDLEITVLNKAGFILPETGGTGVFVYLFSGILLIGSSLLIACGMRRRNERRIQ